jgi:hypothetical protein
VQDQAPSHTVSLLVKRCLLYVRGTWDSPQQQAPNIDSAGSHRCEGQTMLPWFTLPCVNTNRGVLKHCLFTVLVTVCCLALLLSWFVGEIEEDASQCTDREASWSLGRNWKLLTQRDLLLFYCPSSCPVCLYTVLYSLCMNILYSQHSSSWYTYYCIRWGERGVYAELFT